MDWAPDCEPKHHRLNYQSGHMPGLGSGSPVGGVWEATTHWCFSSSLSASLPLLDMLFIFRVGKGGRKRGRETSILKKKILFIFRGEGREKERKRNISVWLPLTHPLLGTQSTTQACALTGNRTGDPLVHRPALNPLSHTSQGCFTFH